MLHTNNSGWFGDFAPLTGGEEQPAEPATAPAAPESPPSDQGSTEHVEPVAPATADSAASYSEPDHSVPASSGWDWIATEPDGDELSADQVVATESTADDSPLPSPAFPMDYAATATRPAVRKPPHHRRSLRGYVIAGAMLAVVLVIGAGAALALGGGDDNTSTTQSTPPESVAPPAAPNTAPDPAACPSRTVNTVTTGRDAGGTSSGPDVIKAFEYAYYVERNGRKARSYASELARMGSAESMQIYIDTALAPGTVHCVKITDRGPGLWALELTETPPAGSEPLVIKQIVQTAQIDGRFYIVAITKDTAP